MPLRCVRLDVGNNFYKDRQNPLAPINKLAPETLALVAGFLEPGHQLINAIVLAYSPALVPWLWNRIRSSDWRLLEVELWLPNTVLASDGGAGYCLPDIKSLTVHSGYEYEIRRALRLEGVAGWAWSGD